MTGRELIIFIMTNHLENEEVFVDGVPNAGFLSEEEMAAKFEVGFSTIRVWCEKKYIPSVKVGDIYYIPTDAKRPVLHIGEKFRR